MPWPVDFNMPWPVHFNGRFDKSSRFNKPVQNMWFTFSLVSDYLDSSVLCLLFGGALVRVLYLGPDT